MFLFLSTKSKRAFITANHYTERGDLGLVLISCMVRVCDDVTYLADLAVPIICTGELLLEGKSFTGDP